MCVCCGGVIHWHESTNFIYVCSDDGSVLTKVGGHFISGGTQDTDNYQYSCMRPDPITVPANSRYGVSSNDTNAAIPKWGRVYAYTDGAGNLRRTLDYPCGEQISLVSINSLNQYLMVHIDFCMRD